MVYFSLSGRQSLYHGVTFKTCVLTQMCFDRVSTGPDAALPWQLPCSCQRSNHHPNGPHGNEHTMLENEDGKGTAGSTQPGVFSSRNTPVFWSKVIFPQLLSSLSPQINISAPCLTKQDFYRENDLKSKRIGTRHLALMVIITRLL